MVPVSQKHQLLPATKLQLTTKEHQFLHVGPRLDAAQNKTLTGTWTTTELASVPLR